MLLTFSAVSFGEGGGWRSEKTRQATTQHTHQTTHTEHKKTKTKAKTKSEMQQHGVKPVDAKRFKTEACEEIRCPDMENNHKNANFTTTFHLFMYLWE